MALLYVARVQHKGLVKLHLPQKTNKQTTTNLLISEPLPKRAEPSRRPAGERQQVAVSTTVNPSQSASSIPWPSRTWGRGAGKAGGAGRRTEQFSWNRSFTKNVVII